MKDKSSPSQEEEKKAEPGQPEKPTASEETPKEGLHWPKQPATFEEESRPSQHTGRWILGLLAALIVGFGAAFFALALPAQQELRQVKADLANAQEKLATVESDLKTTSAELDGAEKELTGAQYSLALARVQANVAYARASLVSRDLLTARQEVSAAMTNMGVLLPLIKDKDISAALSERMTVIYKALYNDSATKALEELRILNENLLRLEEQP